ncbi:MAG: NAD(P)/FAD-dependent oxidoreductase, partial [Dehalococcoidia bacterium]
MSASRVSAPAPTTANGSSGYGRGPHVVIVGAGFGGLEATRRLANLPVRVTLIDRHNYHLFTPLLYQVATAGLEPEEIAHPVRAILRGQPNVRFLVAEVRRVDLEHKLVDTDAGEVTYDYLVLAAGSTTGFFGLTGVEAAATGLKDVDEALELRNRI